MSLITDSVHIPKENNDSKEIVQEQLSATPYWCRFYNSIGDEASTGILSITIPS